MSKPTYIYKVISSVNPPPEPLPDRLALSKLDTSSGFIHLSTSIQIPRTLKHFFADEPHVHVLRIEYDPIEKDIRWEDPKGQVRGERGGEGIFPHLYNGGRLGNEEVESVFVLKNDGAGWDDTLKGASPWLLY